MGLIVAASNGASHLQFTTKCCTTSAHRAQGYPIVHRWRREFAAQVRSGSESATAAGKERHVWPPREGPIDLEGLVAEYGDRVYAITLRITGSPEEAEDATQDTFLSAFRNRDRFRSESNVGSWLYRIAINAALQIVRKRRPVEPLESTGYSSAHVPDWSAELFQRLELSELRTALEQGIALLPEDARVALVLRDVEQFSTAETAEILEITEPAVKSRLRRARVLLRQYLADYLEHQ
jgi:RNA polymerase sigma-70 factor (ECF subfamily)